MATAIAESLLHFIWQGTALGVLAYLMLRRVGDDPRARYAVGLGTLAAMALAPVVTALWLLSGGVAPSVGISGAVAVNAGNSLPVAWVLGCWATGVAVCAVRLSGGWILARRMATTAAAPVSHELQIIASRVAARLSVSTPFVVLESAIAASPMMVGWLKPVILLPSAAIAGLAPSQLEALLAHELGHIRRHDYIVNLLQSVVESLLFFHPAVWLVSREVREAREQCCDDLTVSVCDRLVYVSALSRVASLRAASPALAARGGSLRNRVQRILRPQPAASPSLSWLAVAPVALVLAAAMPVTGTPETVAAPRVETTHARVDGSLVSGASAQKLLQELQPQRSMTTPAVERASLTPAPPALPMTPALPVVLNYFTVPAQAMELQSPPPPLLAQQTVAPADYAITVEGHVVKPGEYRLRPEQMTVIRAITAAGGFSHDAGASLEIIRHDSRGVVERIRVTRVQLESGDDPRLLSGDIVSIHQGRVFFINGEVSSPGQKVWAPGMTVLKAVGLAGGMTPRGKLSYIERPVKDENGRILKYEKVRRLKPETEIRPDDVLVVARKWFGE